MNSKWAYLPLVLVFVVFVVVCFLMIREGGIVNPFDTTSTPEIPTEGTVALGDGVTYDFATQLYHFDPCVVQTMPSLDDQGGETQVCVYESNVNLRAQ